MNTITAAEFGSKAASGTACIVDVRTPAEFSECHVTGARLAPLDSLDPRAVTDAVKPAANEPIFLLCKGGTRARKAAEQFIAAGITNVCVVEGGTEACVAANLPVERGSRSTIPLDGQVRIAIGALLLLFWVLAHFVGAITYLIPALAVGLIFSGVTGFCGMAIILGKAPWNQRPGVETIGQKK